METDLEFVRRIGRDWTLWTMPEIDRLLRLADGFALIVEHRLCVAYEPDGTFTVEKEQWESVEFGPRTIGAVPTKLTPSVIAAETAAELGNAVRAVAAKIQEGK